MLEQPYDEQEGGDRVLRVIRNLCIGAVVAVVLAACVVAGLVISSAQAAPAGGLVARGWSTDGSPFVLRLFQGPCTAPEVVKRMQEQAKRMKASLLIWREKPYKGCWIERDGTVWNIDSEGDIFNGRDGLPKSIFVDESV